MYCRQTEGIASETNENWEFGEFSILEADGTEAPIQGKVKISPSKVMNMQVDGISARALKNSGAQISLVSTGIFGERSLDLLENITVQCVFGKHATSFG